ncbi:MAG TPA: GntR family transcriptional regulator [Devosia sp.]|nr:GntR family transcriptional regulator [Devosia sp.]
MTEQTTSRANAVYETLRGAIKDGRYAGGARLRERDIAAELGVSRTPVREALLRLVSRGLLDAAPGGLVVRDLSRRQILELYASREVLEGGVAGFAAQHASESEVANLRRLAAAFAATGGSLAGVVRANRSFHTALYEAAHNSYLVQLIGDLNDSLALLRISTFEIEGRFASAIVEHEAIVDAVARHDAAAADSSARLHIRKSTEARLQLIES